MAKTRTKVLLWYLTMAGVSGGALAAWRRQRRWGASDAEIRTALPGDDLVPQPDLQATRAIRIGARPEAVWPWLVQLGEDKAGFYSYDWLERLAGMDVRNSDVVAPEWQGLAQGDRVRLAEGIELNVALADPPHALVLDNLAAPGPHFALSAFDFTWAFVLEPDRSEGSRLVIRERYAWSAWRVGLVVKAVSWVSFVMSRAMLLGIKRRAERNEPS
ncbi:MAG: hypothetical protein LBK54_01250 [Propionibacteriaceae bacterium]|jgi:hypothetical protein|nr:hypothetical protein [Propionibacteriaceae bacterium]